jgi:hypothetical protein
MARFLARRSKVSRPFSFAWSNCFWCVSHLVLRVSVPQFRQGLRKLGMVDSFGCWCWEVVCVFAAGTVAPCGGGVVE